MAKRKSEKVVLEDIELRPQVIGHIYEKKTNIGRVLIIFAILLLVVYYINDISVFVNNLLGKKSATTIQEQTNENQKRIKNDENNDDYYMFNDSLTIIIDNLTFAHFKNENQVVSFDVYNYTENDIDLSNKNYYLETYNSNKNLIESLKIDFNKIEKKNKACISLNVKKEFTYLKIVEKI